jgi:hypothetical protein
MATAKPEVLTSQRLYAYGIGTKFQRLPSHFWVQLFNGAMANHVWCNRKAEIQHGGLQTGSIFISVTTILEFRLPVTTSMVHHSSIEKLDPKNVELAVEISLFLHVKAEICAVLV